MPYLDQQRDRLKSKLQQHTTCATQPWDLREPFVLTSCLQKALRRGDAAIATAAAQALLLVDAARAWRRLVTVVFEDFGLTDLALTNSVVAVAADKRWRLDVGGDAHVASYLIEQMVSRPRDRRIDNLYMLAVRHVTHPACRAAFFAQRPSGTATDLVLRAEHIVAECEQTVPYRSIRAVRASQCDAALNEMRAGGGADDDLRTVCIQGRRTSNCLLPVLLPLAKQATEQVGGERSVLFNEAPIMRQIGEVPGYAIDGFTRRGNEALARLARSNRDVARVVSGLVGKGKSDALTYLLFEAEGGVCTAEVSDPLYEELKRLALGCWTGLPREAVPDAIAIMRAAIPHLNELREELMLSQLEFRA